MEASSEIPQVFSSRLSAQGARHARPSVGAGQGWKGRSHSGDAYTLAQYQKMFATAGFRSSKQHEFPVPQQLIISEK
jgi:hypothetical protein